MNLFSLLAYLIGIFWYFIPVVFNQSDSLGVKLQYLYAWFILIFIGLLSSYLMYLHYKVLYTAKLWSKKKIMMKLFEEVNSVDFPSGDLEFVAGDHAAWFVVKIYNEKSKLVI